MNKITITENIPIKPNLLNKNILWNIENTLQQIYTGLCDEKYGYIQTVHSDDTKIHSNSITKNDVIYFVVSFSAECIIPAKGKRLQGKVCAISKEGFVVEIVPEIRVSVLEDSLADYKFSKGKFSTEGTTIGTGSVVYVLIEQIKYENKRFNCVGKLA